MISRKRRTNLRRLGVIATLVLSMVIPTSGSASAAVTWSQTSKVDVVFDGKFYNPQYDLQYSSAYIFDNDADRIHFYLDFLQVPTVKMFNDGKDSFAAIKLDYDFDGTADVSLYTDTVDLKTNLVSVPGYSFDSRTESNLNCPVSVFTDISSQSKWVGFYVSRSCIKLPSTFNLFGVARFDALNRQDSYDFAPYPGFKVILPATSTGSGATSATATTSGTTYPLAANKLNSSSSAKSYSDAPEDLSKLSETLLPSVVTVKCLQGSGTGWSADATLSTSMQSAGFLSLILTNHHVISECLNTKTVTLTLSNGTSIAGSIVAWNEDLDVAGITTKTVIPALQWIGSRPKQGWWVGVLGSPLGTSGILTTGIISSVNSISETFTFTAAINPGNSGGPVFDSTGRVLGLATSKRLISTDTIAEGFGNAQGTPLLCNSIILCVAEKAPWGATSKFTAGPSASELATASAAKIAQDKAVAEAKAAAEAAAKIAQDKAVAEAKAAVEAAAKIAQEKVVSESRSVSEQLAKLQSDYSVLSANFSSNLSKYNEAMAQVTFLQGVVKTLQTQVEGLLKPKPETIVCTKGTSFKIVKAIAPKCPVGYKKN